MIAIIVVPLLALIIVASSIRVVKPGTVADVERFGKYLKTVPPSIVFLVPFADKLRVVGMESRTLDFAASSPTRENQTVTGHMSVTYQITDPNAAQRQVVDYGSAIEQAFTTALRDVVSTLSVDAVSQYQDRILAQVRQDASQRTAAFGVSVTAFTLAPLARLTTHAAPVTD